MAITMKELAYMAGVSRSTVDRVLNGRGRVNAETEQRIRALADSMDYQPNLAAKSLANRHKNYKIGFVTNRIGNTFFDEVVAGAQKAAEELAVFGITVIVKDTKGFFVKQQIKMIDELIEEQVNAIAITPINHPDIADKLNELVRNDVAIVAVTADITGVDYLSFVGCNHEQAGRIAGELAAIITGGHGKAAVIVGSIQMLGHSLREKGFQDVIREKYSGLQVEHILENQDDDIVSYNVVTELLQKKPELDVLFFAAAGTNGGIRAIIESGYAGRVKIIAFDLTESNRQYLEQGIISFFLCQQPFEQGYTSVKLLSNWLISGEVPSQPNIYMKTEIIINESK